MESVYIETTIVSFLRQNPMAATESVRRQKATLDWWENHRHRYELATAQYVLDEAGSGDKSLANDRLKWLDGIPLLPLGKEINDLANEIVSRAILLPADAIVDALHIACASVNRVNYLMTWNCKHIANPMILPRVFRTLDDYGLPFPIICTPQDMIR